MLVFNSQKSLYQDLRVSLEKDGLKIQITEEMSVLTYTIPLDELDEFVFFINKRNEKRGQNYYEGFRNYYESKNG